MDIKGLRQAVPVIAKLKRTIMLHGEHGIGKSEIVRDILEGEGYDVWDVRLGQMADAGDLSGLPDFAVDEKGNKYTNFIFPKFIPREGDKKRAIFFDELNRAPKDILQGVFEMVLDYSFKGVPLPKDTIIICAVNPATGDYAVLDFSDKAFLDRFVHIKFSPTAKEFFEYMNTKYSGSGLLEYTMEDSKMLSGNLETFDIVTGVTPSRRSWEVAFRMEQMYDRGEIERGIFLELLMGIVGSTAATSAMTYKETHVGAIRGKDLIENFHNKEISNRLANAVKKSRTDIVGNAIQEIGEELEKRKNLTAQEGENLVAVVKALNPEQAYTVATLMTSKGHNACSNVEGYPTEDQDPDNYGLLNNDDFVALFEKTRKAREKAAKESEKKATKPKKTKEVVEEEL